jgi:hypothetical protein
MKRILLLLLAIALISGLCAGDGNEFVNILNPQDGSLVSQRSMVDGNSSAVSGIRAYVLVWPFETDGPWWIQPTQTNSDGSWESNAYFGSDGSIINGKTYKIIAIITGHELIPGEVFFNLPPHLAKSDEIKVKGANGDSP